MKNRYLKWSFGAHSELFSGINIVPFTDIVLVLLIIFMIAAPGLMHSGLGIQLPGAKNTDPDPMKQLRLSLDTNQNIYWEDVKIQTSELSQKIKEWKITHPRSGVILQADQKVSHGDVIHILDVLRSVGIQKIYVGTRKE